MNRRATLLFTLALAVAPARAQTTTWLMPSEYPATAMPGEGVTTFAAAVAKRLDGRLTIKPALNNELKLKSADMPSAVAAGRAQAADAFGGAMGSVSTAFALSSLPFVTASLEDARKLADAGRPLYAKTFAGLGLKLLYVTPWPPSGIWSKGALAGPADLQGLAIRTYDGTSTGVLKAAGANAQNLSFNEVMPKLAEGSVTAVLSSGDGGAGRRLWTHLPHFTAVNYAFPLSFAFVAQAAFDALPLEDRRLVEEAAAETEARQWAAMAGRLERNYETMRGNGVAIVPQPPAALLDALKAAAKPAVDAWAAQAGDEGRAALGALRQ
jgi:TRAP-type C4-dicarboxylate transport system substrate-binding protein